MKNYWVIFMVLIFTTLSSCAQKVDPPAPFGAIPSAQQLDWYEMEYYGFVHFNMNTFTDIEWGHGSEKPEQFIPTELDCRQWAKVCKEAGMKGIILTAKHHDGFCLWPSEYTEHSVKNSPWKDGKGDVLKELSEACKEYGLKMGLYLSPWDRNHAQYGQPEYIEYFRNQLREILTNYGEIFEVWFDGANGGDGHYGGANETRKIDRKTYYDWPNTYKIVRELQPDALIFSDGGPEVRWIGNEKGFAGATNWATYNRGDAVPGIANMRSLNEGDLNGSHWVPGEVDVSIRPGWYYHPAEDDKVKSADHLELIWYQSVGRNANLLLNLPVDSRGLVHEADVKALKQLKEKLDATFSNNFAEGATATATNKRGKGYAPKNILDGKKKTYWATEDEKTTASVEIELPEARTFNVVEIQEYIPLGQRVEEFSIDAYLNDKWEEIGKGTTIGYKRLVNIPEISTNKIRLNINSALAPPTLSNVSLYLAPHKNFLLESPKEFDNRMSWWRDDKFGMFIHWGAYAIPAGVHKGKKIKGIGEWIMSSASIPVKEYENYVRQFNPVQYDAEEWVRIAKDAGMKYIVITSKHHDGFGLWDSEVSDFDIMDAAPYKKDLLKALSEACKKEDIRLCFYHSIMDWHHPDAQAPHYPNYNTRAKQNPNFNNYAENYMKPQLKELVDNYDPHVMWFDGEWIPEWTEPAGKDLYQFVRSLKPEIIINNRVGKGRRGMQGMNAGKEYAGDFGTPEQEILEHGSSDIDWESCMTMNDTWGFKKHDSNWKSSEMLIHNLVDIAAKGGNYLLNVGPTAEGLIPAPSVERLADMGEWMRTNGEAIYGTRMWKQYKEGKNIRFTSKGKNTVYVTSLGWPGRVLNLKFIQPQEGSEIKMLGYDEALDWTYDETNGLDIQMPKSLQKATNRPCEHAFVFKITAKALTAN
ncbi:MAG: hypothetical protein GY705_14015 [Bacteroidetes bacterium]|nr:hypothetical protein [Bacteroidota bacterium]